MKSSLKIRGSGIFIVVIALCILMCSNFAIAQIHFTASAPKSVAENQNFNLSITLENANGSNLKLPPLNDFTLLAGPTTSSSTQWINGVVTQAVSYNYVLRPKQQGTFRIGKATMEVNGNIIESNDITIQVTAPSANSQSQQGNQHNQQQSQSNADLAAQLKDDVFVKVYLTKSSVYKGEMLTATYKLYLPQSVNQYRSVINKSPTLDGFWSKQIDLDPNKRPAVENYNGKQYYTIEILKYNLFPQRSGAMQISPAEISATVQVVVRTQSNDPFGDFFNMGQARNVPLTFKSDFATVNVKELPENGKPADFTGAVGKFNFEASLSGKESKTDDPVTYTIKISGTGNLSLIDAPSLQVPIGFEVYDPKVKERISSTLAGMSGSKQYDYLIIPRQPGDYKIGGKAFSYFDPSTGKYYSITSLEYPLKITGEPSKNLNSNSSSYITQQGVSMLGEDIRYIKTFVPPFDKTNKPFFASAGFLALYSFPFLLFIGLIAARRRNETLAVDITGMKRRRALKVAKKRLRHAEKNLAHKEKKNFYDEVSRAIWGYLGDKLNIDMAELSKETVAEKLFARNVKPETINKLQNLINSCERSLYAPSADDTEMKIDYTTALNLIADLEDEIRS